MWLLVYLDQCGQINCSTDNVTRNLLEKRVKSWYRVGWNGLLTILCYWVCIHILSG